MAELSAIAVFIILYGFGIGSLVYWITDFLHWCWEKVKQAREKKRQASGESEK